MLLLCLALALSISLSHSHVLLSPSLSPSLSLSLSPSLSLSVYFPQTGSPSRERVVRECNHRGANAEHQRGSHCRLGGAEEVQRVRRMIEWLQTVEVGVSRLTMGEWTAVCLVRPVNRSLKTVVITSGVICLESDDMPSLYYAVTPLLPIHPLFSLSPWFLGSLVPWFFFRRYAVRQSCGNSGKARTDSTASLAACTARCHTEPECSSGYFNANVRRRGVNPPCSVSEGPTHATFLSGRDAICNGDPLPNP